MGFPDKTVFCKFHRQGRCTRGSNCTYAHSEAEIRRPSSSGAAVQPRDSSDPLSRADSQGRLADRESSTNIGRPSSVGALARASSRAAGGWRGTEQYERRHWQGAAQQQGRCAAKSLEERQQERERQGLPILAKRLEFLEMLQASKAVIVVAATGSGKTTQLPQYAAEEIPGLVVCTQPRALAAEDIAKRVAGEFDGHIGENVGFRARREVRGRRIMFVTDATLISMAQQDAALGDVGVLIIDEAHERSLNTDIVLGIARRLREQRPRDFHVVVASATIDPGDFLRFFGPAARVLDVPGRTFAVEEEYRPGEEMIPVCLEALREHPVGNVIAFLPGQQEVERATANFLRSAPEGVRAFPLHGGLQSEEQAKVTQWAGRRGERMVVFATNVAETSLTIPGVRLVLDSGLAKEARYDPERRMTLLELVMISRSSADQRKGRSGRIAPGHCIRLYAEQDLVRTSVQPEILRASLDHAVLQLCMLRYNPLTFHYITRPAQASLESSMKMLTQIGCLDAGQGCPEITERGRVFADLPFDPRLSHFIATAGQRYGREELAAEVAAIISAPGSVFFMGGEAREAAKKKMVQLAGQHQSDLLLKVQVYRQWADRGERGLRVAFAKEQGLNNKVLQVVADTARSTLESLRATLLKERSASADEQPEDLEVVARCLLASFPEQLAQMLVPDDPQLGAFLFCNRELRGTVSQMSTIMQSPTREAWGGLFICMSPTIIPSGALVVDSNHPIKDEWLDEERVAQVEAEGLHMTVCWARPNLGKRFSKVLHEVFRADTASFVVPQYDDAKAVLRVLSPKSCAAAVAKRCKEVIDEEVRSDLEHEQFVVICSGTVLATVESGMVIRRLERFGPRCRTCFKDLPEEFYSEGCPNHLDSQQSLQHFLETSLGVDQRQIRWIQYFPGSHEGPHSGAAVFADGEIAEKAAQVYAQFQQKQRGLGGGLTGPASALPAAREEHTWGRSVLWSMARGFDTDSAAVAAARANDAVGGLLEKALRVTVVRRFADKFELSLRNLPPEMDAPALQSLLPSAPAASYAPDPGERPTRIAKFEFATQADCDAAHGRLSPLTGQPFTILIPDRKGRGRMHQKTVSAEIASSVKRGSCQISVSFESIADAEAFCAQLPGEAQGEARVTLPYWQLLDGLARTAADVAQKFAVEVKRMQSGKARGCVVFQGSPSSCGQAAQRLASLTAPLKLQLRDRSQQQLFHELLQSGQMSRWEEELGLLVEPRWDARSMEMTFAWVSEALVPHEEVAKRVAEHFGLPGQHVVAHAKEGKISLCFRKLTARDQKKLRSIKEAALGDLLQGRVAELAVENAGLPEQLTIHGWQLKQGELMRRIGEFQEASKARYAMWGVDTAGSRLFQHASSPGALLLSALASEMGEGAVLEYNAGLGGIEVALPPTVSNVADVLLAAKARVDELLQRRGQEGAAVVTCNFCQESTGHPLTICGHRACAPCLQKAVRGNLASSIGCARCGTRISMKDLKLDQRDLQRSVAEAAHAWVAASSNLEFATCPMTGCLGLLSRLDGYVHCVSCGAQVCGNCRAANDPLHKGISCDEYRIRKVQRECEEQLRSAIKEEEREWERHGMTMIEQQARDFLEKQWDPTVGNVEQVCINPGLRRGCPAMQLFVRGCRSLSKAVSGGCKEVLRSGSFGWHGTKTDKGIAGICHDGFDPGRRSGQAHGPGEYFGTRAAISKGYCGSARMIVVFILKPPGPAFKEVPGFCYVVNNPCDKSLSYCLPVLVATFASLPALAFVEAPPVPVVWGDGHSSMASAKSEQWSMPFRWHWMQDSGAFEPYTADISALLETAYNSFTRCAGPHKMTTPPLTRYLDDIPRPYDIDFAHLTQTSQLGIRRSIERRKVEAAAHGHWLFEDGGAWTAYDPLVQNEIEEAYRKYLDSMGDPSVCIHCPGRPEEYRIDFMKGRQSNLSSGQERGVRRAKGLLHFEPPQPPSYWKHKSGEFHNVEDSPWVRSLADGLLNGTHANIATKDRHGPVPSGFRVVEARRIENSAMWARYAMFCQRLQARGRVRQVKVRTGTELPDAAERGLNESINEVYLFHGTSLQSAEAIASSGFKVDMAGSATGASFGRGAYFAERSTKSDEYSKASHSRGVEEYAMLLCRVCLGEVLELKDFDSEGHKRVKEALCHSLLGNREAAVKTFREFVVYEGDQVYPEYIMIYKRR